MTRPLSAASLVALAGALLKLIVHLCSGPSTLDYLIDVATLLMIEQFSKSPSDSDGHGPSVGKA